MTPADTPDLSAAGAASDLQAEAGGEADPRRGPDDGVPNASNGGEGSGGEGPRPPRRRRRWLPWALAASLCVNFLLIGAAGGAFLRHGGPPPHAPQMPAGFDRVSLWRMMRALPEDARDEARRQVHAHREDLRGLSRQRDAARAEIARALDAQPFDPQALAAAVAAAREAERRSRDLADRLLVEVASDLSDETRDEIAEALRDRARNRWHDDRPPRP